MTLVDLLHNLQEIDAALDGQRDRLAGVVAELADRSGVLAQRRARDGRAEAARALQATQRDLELEVETYRRQLDEAEKKLYGGRVADAKELSNLQKDAEQIRKLISPREDRLLELFEGADRAAAELAAAEAALRDGVAARRAHEAALAAERDRLRASIEADEARRDAVRAQLDPASLRTYDNLRRTRGGLAVAEVRQRTCQGCRIGLTAGEEQRIRAGNTVTLCQSCGRILHARG